MTYVVIYLAAIVAANLTLAVVSPNWSPAIAFVLIGLDLTLRDRLHDTWAHKQLAVKMGALIAAGGTLSYLLNPAAARIAAASSIAFTAAATLDAAAYHAARHWPWTARANTSNMAGAATDSLLFPTIAFGTILPAVIAGQFVAKVAGGFLWTVALTGQPRAAARNES